MFEHSPAADIPTAVVLYSIAILAVWLWMFRSSQEVIHRTWAVWGHICLRVALVFGCLYAICYLLGWAFWIPVAVLAVLVVTGGPLEGSLFALPAMIVVYAICQYVLGFPDRASWFLPGVPDRPREREEREPSPYVGRLATSTTPLKPSGEVEIDGARRSATSYGSQFIDAGVEVEILELRNGLLVVREAARN